VKAIMIAAPASGSGKTTVTMGLLRLWRRQGVEVGGFKVGPDYIDPAFLSAAAGVPARNLDLHLQGAAGIAWTVRRAACACGVIEGVMGYFDGIANTWQNSSYHLSRLLNIPTVLVYTPKGEMFSAIPQIKGLAEFDGSQIQAVLFNGVNERTYRLLADALTDHSTLKMLGFVPPLAKIALQSRHLGLVQSVEIPDLDAKLDELADQLRETVDSAALLGLMTECRLPEDGNAVLPAAFRQRPLTVAIARDAAFSFYYTENLELFEQTCRVVYFSPLRDAGLPDCDLLYLGGGYPEVFCAALGQNMAMLRAVKAYAERGGCVYAECGGLIYLTERVENTALVGIFQGQTRLTPHLQHFGYVDIELQRDCLIGRVGDCLTAHEFHKAVSTIADAPVFRIRKTLGDATWTCGYAYKNVLAGYPHISWLGHLDNFAHLLDYVEQQRHK